MPQDDPCTSVWNRMPVRFLVQFQSLRAFHMQGDLRSQPETGNYTFKQVMQAQNTTYEIDLCPSQLKQVRSAFR